MLPLSFVANTSFPYEAKLAIAREYLAIQGITNPRPIRRTAPTARPYDGSLQTRPTLTLVDRARLQTPVQAP